jgi:hypothetical protein
MRDSLNPHRAQTCTTLSCFGVDAGRRRPWYLVQVLGSRTQTCATLSYAALSSWRLGRPSPRRVQTCATLSCAAPSARNAGMPAARRRRPAAWLLVPGARSWRGAAPRSSESSRAEARCAARVHAAVRRGARLSRVQRSAHGVSAGPILIPHRAQTCATLSCAAPSAWRLARPHWCPIRGRGRLKLHRRSLKARAGHTHSDAHTRTKGPGRTRAQ